MGGKGGMIDCTPIDFSWTLFYFVGFLLKPLAVKLKTMLLFAYGLKGQDKSSHKEILFSNQTSLEQTPFRLI